MSGLMRSGHCLCVGSVCFCTKAVLEEIFLFVNLNKGKIFPEFLGAETVTPLVGRNSFRLIRSSNSKCTRNFSSRH